MTDRENFPILYWTFVSMTGLLIGTFTVFWIHTLLWMVRGFVDIFVHPPSLDELRRRLEGRGDSRNR